MNSSTLNPCAQEFVPSTSPPAAGPVFDWESIAPTAEEEEELDACDAWVAALVEAEIADEQQEAAMEAEAKADVLSAAVSAVSVH